MEADISILHKPDILILRRQSPQIFALGESMGAGLALQSAGVEPRIEAVVAEASFATLREASYDYAGLRRSPLLGKTIFAPFSWMLLYRGEKITSLPVDEISPEKAVASRAFPVLLICDEKDDALPCRHTQLIYAAARAPNNSGKSPAHFTPPHSASYPPSSSAASWNFSLTLRSPSPSNNRGTGILACQLLQP